MRETSLIIAVLMFFTYFNLNADIVKVNVGQRYLPLVVDFDHLDIQHHRLKSQKVTISRYKDSWRIKTKNSIILVANKLLTLKGKKLAIDGQEIPGHLLLIAKSKNHVQLVESLKISEYLKGVLASEIPASWPQEALKAQAIASRTYVQNQINNNKNAIYDVKGTIKNQVYQWSRFQNLNDKYKKNIVSAISTTENLVLWNQKEQKYNPSYFHADCGGHTEDPHAVWFKGFGKKNIVDLHSLKTPFSQWSYNIEKEVLEEKIQKELRLSESWHLKELSINRKSASGRVKLIALNDTKKTISGDLLRRILGYKDLKSTKITQFNFDGKNLSIKGKGFGHGVGLCQWGAREKALKGLNFRQILKFYYPKSIIKTI